ncbi:hypothetical protein [Gluconobacter sp. GP1]|uniref:hypothetical protein n=1 Tax=Gluconobacter sp. GP1 TaxID=3046423 RepID=UPI00293F1B2E|nr:hypothetical protein [Gluconobacter sp. GP1]
MTQSILETKLDGLVLSLHAMSETQAIHGKILTTLLDALGVPGTDGNDLVQVIRDVLSTLEKQRHDTEKLNEQIMKLPQQLGDVFASELQHCLTEEVP